MIERLTDSTVSAFGKNLTASSVLPWSAGTVLLLAFVVDPDMVKLVPGLMYMVAGILCALAVQRQDRVFTYAAAAGLIAAASIGLLILPRAGYWPWWLALTGLTLLPLTVASHEHIFDRQTGVTYALLTLSAAVLGVITAGNLRVHADIVILGLGLLTTGQLWILYTMQPHESLLPSLPDERHTRLPPSPGLLRERARGVSVGLNRASDMVTQIALSHNAATEEQKQLLELTGQRADEFLALSRRVKEQARLMADSAHQVSEESQAGQVAVQQAIHGMDEIKQQVASIGTTIVTLAQLTRRIDEIITSVTEIATQSNLLALNASIEAARAGMHGRGFAVVADEVRSLSQQSTTAAQQVRAILAEIQAAVKQTVSATEVGMQSVDTGMGVAQEADAVMNQLVTDISVINTAAEDVQNIVNQQADGLEEISISMARVERITQDSMNLAGPLDQLGASLSRLSADLEATLRGTVQNSVGEATTDLEYQRAD